MNIFLVTGGSFETHSAVFSNEIWYYNMPDLCFTCILVFLQLSTESSLIVSFLDG